MHGFGVACLFFFLPFLAQVSPVPVGPPVQPHQAAVSPGPLVQHALTTSDLEAFFDGVVPLQLERSDIAGAAVRVTQNGQVLLQKGYGYADLKSKKPVDPATTIFRLASISKLFTWVSVMQLVEEGRLDIDTDINRYLDFQIRPAFSRPITLRNLMTHTGGFEEEARDIIVTNPDKRITLRDFLIRNQPQRLFAPGTIPAYSNYGVGLAGYIVQRASGQPFEQYVEQHIFLRLKWRTQPFTSLRQHHCVSYRRKVTAQIQKSLPLASRSSTPSRREDFFDRRNMGRFGQALLNGGELDGNRILKPQTLQAMWTPQSAPVSRCRPCAWAFTRPGAMGCTG